MTRQAHRFPRRRLPGIASLLQQLQVASHESISLLIVMVCTGGFLALATLHRCRIVSWSQALSVLGLSSDGVVQRLWLFQFLTAPGARWWTRRTGRRTTWPKAKPVGQPAARKHQTEIPWEL